MIIEFIKDWTNPSTGSVNKAGTYNQFSPPFAKSLISDGYAKETEFSSMLEAYRSKGNIQDFPETVEAEHMDKDDPDQYLMREEEDPDDDDNKEKAADSPEPLDS